MSSLEDGQDGIERVRTYWEPALAQLRTSRGAAPGKLHIPVILAGSKLDLCLKAEPEGRQRTIGAAKQLLADGELVSVQFQRAFRVLSMC